MKWQPIKTVPKDGSVFLVYGPNLVHEDFNPEGIEFAMHNGQEMVGSLWNPVHDHWELVPIRATHWIPLPQPPREGVQ